MVDSNEDPETIENKNFKGGWKKRAGELVEKGMLDKDQEDSLKKMIDSPDNENFAVAREVVKVKLTEKFCEGLNEGQVAAFNTIIEFLRDPQHEALVLKGYAGTGKTFLVNRVIEYIAQTHPRHNIAITAPTNKAVQVLYKNSKNPNAQLFEDYFDSSSRLVYSTIHKLLGLREVITDSGEQIFRADKSSKSGLDDYKYLIVDEVSMLDDTLCKDIMKFAKKVRIIFMGDPAQIPPVKQLDSIPFRNMMKYNFLEVKLTEIMRQKQDNPIVETSFKLRENLKEKNPIPVLTTQVNAQNHGVIWLNELTEKPKVRPLLEELFKSAQFEADSDYAKVLAWRNKTVNYVNGIIREILYGASPDLYVAGEKLVARKPIFHKDQRGYWKIQYNTSEELVVESVRMQRLQLRESSYRLDALFYMLNVKTFDLSSNRWIKDTIKIVHPNDVPAYTKILNEVKERAILNKDYWKVYYTILKWSADVMYNYALTAHKAQGSTYTNVLLIESDLDMNPNVVERNRIKYTSYSRATDRLYVLRTNQ
jgi:exodeoxyribonuclease-5